MPIRLQLLHGPDALKTLGREPVRQVFAYIPNHIGYSACLLVTLLTALGAIGLWLFADFGTGWAPPFLVLSIALFAVAVGLMAWWWSFTRRHFVAVTPDFLYVGHKTRLWRIAWGVLDKHSLGLDRLEASVARGVLQMRVGGESIPLTLFNLFVNLRDMGGFMQAALASLAPLPAGESGASDEEEALEEPVSDEQACERDDTSQPGG